MARYRKIAPRMWGDEKFQALSRAQPNAQTLWSYLLTGHHTTALPGLWIVGQAELAEALDWPLESLRRCWSEIEEKGMARADWRRRVIYIPKVLRYDAPENPNVVTHWAKHYDEVPDCPLKIQFAQDLKAFLKGLHKGFLEAFLKGFGEGQIENQIRPSGKPEPDPKPLPVPEPDPEPDPEPEVDLRGGTAAREPNPEAQGGNLSDQNPATRKAGQEPEQPRPLRDMIDSLSRKAKMENRQGPGENKRRLKEQARAKSNHAPKKPEDQQAWEAVTLALAEAEPAKWVTHTQTAAAVAAIGGWEYLGMLADTAEAKPRFLEAYRAAETPKDAPASRVAT